MGHDHGSAAAGHRGRLVAVLALSLTILVVEVVGAARRQQPRPARGCRPRADRRRRASGSRSLAIWFAGAQPDERPHLRLPAARDPRRGHQRVPAVRDRGVRPVRGLAAAVRAARDRVGADARGRARRPRRERRLAVPAARRAAREPEHARRLPRGHGRLRGIGRRHRRRGRHRADRLDGRRHRRLGAHRPADPAAHVLAPARRHRRAPRGDAQGRRHGPRPRSTSSTRPASSTATTSTPGRSRRG